MESVQPPPLYPPLANKPLNLDKEEVYAEIVRIKQEFRREVNESFFFVELNNETIEKYSDRYAKLKRVNLSSWQTDWTRLPRELKYFYEKEEKAAKRKSKLFQPNLSAKRKTKNNLDLGKIMEVRIDPETFEKQDEAEEGEEGEDKDLEAKKPKKEGEEEEENGDEEENLEEEEMEEENDYIDSYFDNGENDFDDLDGGGGGDDEGPVY